MTSGRPFSIAARRRLRTPSLVWGAILLVLWLSITLTIRHSETPHAALTAQAYLWILFLPGVALLVRGVRGLVTACRFHRMDTAFAESLAVNLDQLWRTAPFEAYRVDDRMVEVPQARLVEIERHFDQQTVGIVAGGLHQQLQVFGSTLGYCYGAAGFGTLAGTISGMSTVELGLSTSTRDNLMGDALFAVFEASGPAGEHDTYRVVSMSATGAARWIRDLVVGSTMRLEGNQSHAGATLLSWSGHLAAHFAPRDISYLTDRLRAQAAHPPAERDTLVIRGPLVARNAVLAAHAQIGAGEPLLVLPIRFPVLLAEAVAGAARQADQSLVSDAPRRLG